MKIGIAVAKIRTAVEGESILDAERTELLAAVTNCKGNTMQVDVSKLSHAVIANLLAEDLSDAQRRILSLFHLGAQNEPNKVLDAEVGTPAEFHSAISALATNTEPGAEIMINGRWYPILLSTSLTTGWGSGDKVCQLSASYKICDMTDSFNRYVTMNVFLDDDDNRISFTVTELLLKLGIRPLQTDLREHFDNLRLADRFQQRTGHAASATGAAIMFENRNWWRGMDFVELGTPTRPGPVVIEGEMEKENGYTYGNNTEWKLPFVRVFSLEKKRYAYLDVRDIAERDWDENALDSLVLTPELENILRKIFDAPSDQLFGDIVSGKAGGMIVLAEGGPGVGKTMTAETFSEHTKRPLYVLEMAELGTSLATVEDSLRKIFRRAARWNAVLLFDEADVFMAKRDDNLERSAIVGVFLRLMDYYKGMLFLTSNRSDVIDPAFKSRITLSLKYPPLDAGRRRTIWGTMLKAAGVTLEGDLNGIPDINLNGRQIRNMVRLLRVLHGTTVTPQQIKDVCQFSS